MLYHLLFFNQKRDRNERKPQVLKDLHVIFKKNLKRENSLNNIFMHHRVDIIPLIRVEVTTIGLYKGVVQQRISPLSES